MLCSFIVLMRLACRAICQPQRLSRFAITSSSNKTLSLYTCVLFVWRLYIYCCVSPGDVDICELKKERERARVCSFVCFFCRHPLSDCVTHRVYPPPPIGARCFCHRLFDDEIYHVHICCYPQNKTNSCNLHHCQFYFMLRLHTKEHTTYKTFLQYF
jgi:hypothetical protein